jgi:MFS family permease|eukprot:31015-Pelagococcus_subviridis.AAC.2
MEKPRERWTIASLSARIGWGKSQWLVFFFVGLCVAAASVQVNFVSFLAVELKREWGLSSFSSNTLLAVQFLGEMIGCAVFGVYADRRGRRPAFVLGTLFVAVFGVASAFSTRLVAMLILRGLVGVGIGGITVPFDLLAEACPPALRGVVLCAIWTHWTLGSLGVIGAAWACLDGPNGPVAGEAANPLGWRVLTLIASIPPALSLFGICYLEESPAWLAARGRADDAKAIVLRAAARNGVPLDADAFDVAPEEENTEGAKALFRGGNFKRTMCVWTLSLTAQCAYYGVVLFLPLSTSSHADVAGGSYNFDALATSCGGELFGVVAGSYFVSILSRRVVLCASSVIVLIAVPTVLIDEEMAPGWTLTLTALLARGAAMNFASVVWLVTPESYGVKIRATGHAYGNFWARMGDLVTTYVGGTSMPEVAKVLAYSSFSLASLGAALLLPPGVMAGSRGRGRGESGEEDDDDDDEHEESARLLGSAKTGVTRRASAYESYA